MKTIPFYRLINDPFLRPTRGIALVSLAGCLMLLTRIAYTGSLMHTYLLWNLYLAWMPLFIAYYLQRRINNNPALHKLKLYFLSFLWLLFFPNAPYIVTDFIHLNASSGSLLLLDSVLIFTFAFAGLAAGWLSLHRMYMIMKNYYTASKAKFFVLISATLSGYGVFVGRELRWNSWDIFTNPLSLLSDCLMHLNNKTAIAMTIFFSILILAGYWVFVNLIKLNDEHYR